MGEEEALFSSALLRWVCVVVVTFSITSIKYPQQKDGIGATPN